MVSICFYFQVHQPYRLKNYSIFDVGESEDYYDEAKNKEIAKKVANKCYLPMNNLLLELIDTHNGAFKVSFSVSGVALEQFSEYTPEVLASFQSLAKTGCVEFLSETYYHSLAYLYSKTEFVAQVQKHKELIQNLFGQTPTTFRNTELIFNNELAKHVQDMGYKAILAEGADHIMGWRTPNFVYTARTAPNIKLMLKNYKLSDDIAFRFSNKGWNEWPLDVSKYMKWINENNGNGHTINLFMDYETFGEHQWEDTGIFEFMRHLPGEVLKHPDNNFMTVGEAAEAYDPMGELDIHHFISWADLERDLSAWLGNDIQHASINELYKLEQEIMETEDEKLIDAWRKLTTSDHFYYMCTKWFSDGDVHKYFNPYDSPYDCYINMMNVLVDIKRRVREHNQQGENIQKKQKVTI